MTNLLRQINETWQPHHCEGANSVGCLAFVIDERCVSEDGIEYRLAVSFGHNPYPLDRPKGWLTPDPMPGHFCLGIHCIGTRGNRLAVFDQWCDARPADGCEDSTSGQGIATALLASISDADYFRMSTFGPAEAEHVLTTKALLPLDQYELVDNESTL